MQRGWRAEGLLQPHWKRYPGGRDALAKAVGTKPPTLSAINTGRRNLGWDLGRRLADELGISLLALGAPSEGEAAPRDVYALLAQLVSDADQGRHMLAEALEAIAARLSDIEALLERDEKDRMKV